jgi:hypothetical protein
MELLLSLLKVVHTEHSCLWPCARPICSSAGKEKSNACHWQLIAMGYAWMLAFLHLELEAAGQKKEVKRGYAWLPVCHSRSCQLFRLWACTLALLRMACEEPSMTATLPLDYLTLCYYCFI